MKTFAKSLQLALVAAAAIAFPSVVSAVDVGQPAPDFVLTDLNGQKHSLSNYRGRTVVLEWHNPDCPIVQKHYNSGNIPKLQREATAEGIVWLTVNSAAPGLQGADYDDGWFRNYFKKHNGAPTGYFRDQDGKVGHLYSARTTPHMYIVDPSGTLVYQGAIDSISSSKVDDIGKATNYVRAALTSLKAGEPIKDANTKPYGCAVKYGSGKG